jgi:DNA mismatch repair ATPase MutS
VQDYNKNVAISEEFPNNALGKVKSGGLLFDRKVTRVVTPGTLVDEGFMDPYENNFLLAVYPEKNGSMAERDMGENQETVLPTPVVAKVGLAWLDLSTGEFFTQSIDLGSLSSAIARIGAREILLCETLCGDVRSSILAMLEHERHHITWRPSDTPFQTVMSWSSMLEAQVPADEQAHFSTQEIHAGSLLLEYVHGRLQGLNIKLQPPIRREESENMIIDHNSLKGLEILDTSRTGTVGAKGSLLHAVRRTVTKGGARLLRDRIGEFGCSLSYLYALRWGSSHAETD